MDVAGLAHLLVYVRYIHRGTIKEDMLSCKPLEKRTTAADYYYFFFFFKKEAFVKVWSYN